MNGGPSFSAAAVAPPSALQHPPRLHGVSLEQGLGLTDISRERPGRRLGGERGSPPN